MSVRACFSMWNVNVSYNIWLSAVDCRSILLLPAYSLCRLQNAHASSGQTRSIFETNDGSWAVCVCVLACLHSVRVRALPPTSDTHQCIMYKCTKSKAFHQTFSSSSSLKHSSRSSDVQTITLFCRPSPSRRPQPAFTRIFVYLHLPAFFVFLFTKKERKKEERKCYENIASFATACNTQQHCMCTHFVCVCCTVTSRSQWVQTTKKNEKQKRKIKEGKKHTIWRVFQCFSRQTHSTHKWESYIQIRPPLHAPRNCSRRHRRRCRCRIR